MRGNSNYGISVRAIIRDISYGLWLIFACLMVEVIKQAINNHSVTFILGVLAFSVARIASMMGLLADKRKRLYRE